MRDWIRLVFDVKLSAIKQICDAVCFNQFVDAQTELK